MVSDEEMQGRRNQADRNDLDWAGRLQDPGRRREADQDSLRRKVTELIAPWANYIFAGLDPRTLHGQRVSTCSKGCHSDPWWQPFFFVACSRNKRPCGPVKVACHRAPQFSKRNAERLNARPLSILRKQSPNGGKPLTNIYSALLVVRRRLKRSIRARAPLSKSSIRKLAHRRRYDYRG
jgi:hypothetical protein